MKIMRNWIEHCTIEWESFAEQKIRSLPGPNEVTTLEQMKGNLDIAIELWGFLQKIADSEPNLYVLPSIKIDGFACDAVMMTAGGIYLYHILPAKIESIRVASEFLQVKNGKEEIKWPFGESRRRMYSLANKFGLYNSAIYELYITTVPFEGPFVFENTLILNFKQLSELFQNLIFRKSSHPDLTERFYYFLKEYLHFNPNQFMGISLPELSIEKKDNSEDERNKDIQEELPTNKADLPIICGEETANQSIQIVQNETELECLRQELEEGSKEVASTVNAGDKRETNQPSLPPRRRENKKEPESWFKLLFSKKKR